MNNEEKVNSLEPEDLPSTDTGSKRETTKLPEAGPEDTNPAAPIATETLQASEGGGVLLPQTTLSRMGVRRNINTPGKEWVLNSALRIDDDVAEALYSRNRMVPTYTKIADHPAQEQLQRGYS
jgi:hypothetical protein